MNGSIGARPMAHPLQQTRPADIPPGTTQHVADIRHDVSQVVRPDTAPTLQPPVGAVLVRPPNVAAAPTPAVKTCGCHS